jgi:3-methyl-2-oxobutanoate hydroxymethyltransferase
VSVIKHITRTTAPEIMARKGKEPLVVFSIYSAPMARLFDPHADMLLIGDSLGMVLYGLDSTLQVTLDMMIAHGSAVVRGSERSLVIVDMPWGSYQEGEGQAFRNVARVMAETRCGAVKIEGGVETAETIRYLTQRGVPVMGHVGLMPQRVHALGGYRSRGRGADERARILEDAKAVADAGAFSLVVEGVVEPLARDITMAVGIPTIGIGGSPACDGQVLVGDDMLGLFGDFTPRHVKRYAELAPIVAEAGRRYAEDVRARRFPGPEHVVSGQPKLAAVKTGKKKG